MKRKDLEVALLEKTLLAIRVFGTVREGTITQIGVDYANSFDKRPVSSPLKAKVLAEIQVIGDGRVEVYVAPFASVICTWAEWLKRCEAANAARDAKHEARRQRARAREAKAEQITAELTRIGLPLFAADDLGGDYVIRLEADETVETLLAKLAEIPSAARAKKATR